MKVYSGHGHINVGSGNDLTILELTKLICETVGFVAGITHDIAKSDGTPRKLTSTKKIRALGWTPKIALSDGLASTYRWYLENRVN